VNYAAETLESRRDLQRLVNALGSELDVSEIAVVAGVSPAVVASTRDEWIEMPLEQVPDPRLGLLVRPVLAGGDDRFFNDRGDEQVECVMPLLVSRPDESLCRGAVMVRLDAGDVTREVMHWSLMVGASFCAIAIATFSGVWLLLHRCVLSPVHSIVEAIRGSEGELELPRMENDELGVLAAALDASHREVTQSRREIEFRRRVLESIIESDITGYWDWDIVSGTEYYSPSWKRMLGYEPHELADDPRTWQELIDPRDLERTFESFGRHVESRGAEPFYNEVRYSHRDGTTKWVICTGKVIQWSPDGQPLRMVGCHVDISRGKAAEASLTLSRAQAETALREVNILRTALDDHSIISIADASGRIIDANRAFCQVSGYAREELIGRDHRMIRSGVHPASFWKGVWGTLLGGKAWRGEVCNRRKDGSLYWVDSTIVPYVGPEGRIERYVSIRFDITAQKKAEQALISAQLAAESANAAKSEFLANMSHEIRTPMTAILGFAELLAGDSDVDSTRRAEHIGTIRRNGEHLLAIINDILDLSKIEAGKMSIEAASADPVRLVRDVVALMDVKARAKGLALSVVFESPVPAAVSTDAVRLRQVLVNLIGNAIKFTEVGSVRLAVSADPSRCLMRFDVIDTGIGISAEQCERLFRPFEQADASTTRRFGGTGLGLRISKRLAEMLGGDIAVRSEPGKGSAFTLTVATGPLVHVEFVSPGGLSLPGEAATRAVAAASDLPLSGLPLSGVRILLAEDGPDNQRLLSFQLRKAGAIVTIVENGRLAVEAMTIDGTLQGELATPPRFDVILSDMQMPEMDGYASTRLLRSKGCVLPIVAITAHAMNGDEERCIEAGCDDYASKPVERTKLIELCVRAADLSRSRRRQAA
jgi:PAS domain S-box-containing protein